jgi:hypothetical protein
MAYCLISEFQTEPAWHDLYTALERVRSKVDLFPIQEHGSAVGIAIPRNVAKDAAAELEAITDVLRRFGGVTIDLYSGKEADASELPNIRARLVAE